MNTSTKTIVLWVLLILLFWGAWQVISQEEEMRHIAFSDLLQKAHEGRIASLTIKVEEDGTVARFEAESRDGVTMVSTGVLTDQILYILMEKGVTFEVEGKSRGFWGTILITWTPIIFLLAVLFFFMRGLSGGKGINVVELKKSKAEQVSPSSRKLHFDDVIGAEEAKAALTELVSFLKNPKEMAQHGVDAPRGVLIVGPAGAGKTMLAHALAGETGASFYSTSAAELMEVFVGVGAARVRDTFQLARKTKPSIIFIDDIDLIARKRGSAVMNQDPTEREQTMHQLNRSMDEARKKKEVIVVLAATSRPELLDEVMTTSGRFERVVEIELPNETERLEILRRLLESKSAASDVDPNLLAKETEGLSGGELESLANQAALSAMQRLETGEGVRGSSAEDFARALEDLRSSRALTIDHQ